MLSDFSQLGLRRIRQYSAPFRRIIVNYTLQIEDLHLVLSLYKVSPIGAGVAPMPRSRSVGPWISFVAKNKDCFFVYELQEKAGRERGGKRGVGGGGGGGRQGVLLGSLDLRLYSISEQISSFSKVYLFWIFFCV